MHDDGAVGANEPDLACEVLLGELHRPLLRRELRPAVHEGPDGPAHQVGALVAEKAQQRTVHLDDATALVGKEHRVARLREGRLEEAGPARLCHTPIVAHRAWRQSHICGIEGFGHRPEAVPVALAPVLDLPSDAPMSDGDAVDLIRGALAFDRLRVDAQPIVALSDGNTAAEELLVRVADGDESLIPPLAFIPTAERYGLMPMIDRYVIERAAERAASGRAVYVNLSATTIAQEGLFDDIIGALHRHGATPEQITFEITETAAAADLTEASHLATRLAARGFRIALDDFGSGWGAFRYLKALPVSIIKIDREFVRDISTNAHALALVRGIVGARSPPRPRHDRRGRRGRAHLHPAPVARRRLRAGLPRRPPAADGLAAPEAAEALLRLRPARRPKGRASRWAPPLEVCPPVGDARITAGSDARALAPPDTGDETSVV